MKKKLLLLTAIFFVLCALGFASCGGGEEAPVVSGSEGLSYELTSSGTSYSVTGIGTCTDTDIVIPSTYEGLPVTEIGMDAFYLCSGLTNIVIPDSVTSIGESAFYECSGLTSIVIPDGVTSIGESAFTYCLKLTSVTIGNNVTSIGNAAFWGCSGLTSLTIGNSVTSIGDYAFLGCSGLTSVVIPDSVTSIGEAAFNWCRGLTSIDIPDSVTSIGNYAFSWCSGLTSVTIGNSVTRIGSSAFSGCSGLTSVVIPDSVTRIGSEAFYRCYKLVEVYNLSSLTIKAGSSGNGYVGYYAKNIYTSSSGSSKLFMQGDYQFYADGDEIYLIGYQGSETELILPDDVQGKTYQIYQYAFYNCKGLASVTIGKGVTSIGSYAFDGCNKLVEVYNLSSLTITAGSSDNGYVGYYAKNICTSKDSESKLFMQGDYQFYADGDEIYLIGYQGSETDLILPDDVQGKTYQIYQYAFYECSGLTSVVIPDSVTSIGSYAFYYCISLTSVVIPDSVTSIGSYAFYYCISLTSVVIPDSVTSIGSGAFEGCSGLTSIVIPDSVTSIGDSAFYECSGLTSIVIPDSVTSIGDEAFANCTVLADIYYTGTEEKWNAIEMSDARIPSTATIHYDYIP